MFVGFAPRFFSMRDHVKGFTTSRRRHLPLVGRRREPRLAGQIDDSRLRRLG